VRIAGALPVAIVVSVLFRTGDLDAGFWIDEGIAVGIASHPLADIPALLRADGSPPLYYVLLHGWLALTGGGEAAARSLSLLFAAVTVPVSCWAANAVAGRGAAVAAAAIAAGCPLLGYYAQEARMYTLVALLSVVASAAFVLAFVHRRRRHLVTLGVATQPEQVPVLPRYLPAGLVYLTPLGRPADPTVVDWRDALRRLRAPPRLRLRPGRRVVLVTPVGLRSGAPWSRAIRRSTRRWRAALRRDPRLCRTGATSRPDPARYRSTVRAEIYRVESGTCAASPTS
jgi:hypothetical protein